MFGPHTRSYAISREPQGSQAGYAHLRFPLSWPTSELTVVDQFAFEKLLAPKMPKAFHGGPGSGRQAFVLPLSSADDDVNTFLSFRNLQNVNIIPVSACTTPTSSSTTRQLVLTVAALERLEEVLA